MAEKPILFSADMVRAILAGRKTQTRRVVKESRCKDSGAMLAPCEIAAEVNGGDYRLCPYGAPGDTLWVRETWAAPVNWNDVAPKDIPAWVGCWWLADDKRPLSEEELCWRPSIHMPRWASRITLRVTGVRVERLQEISESDAEAEGVDCFYYGGSTLQDHPKYRDYQGDDTTFKFCARHSFMSLWHTIHAADGPNGWAANPWVWVIAFEKEAQRG